MVFVLCIWIDELAAASTKEITVSLGAPKFEPTVGIPLGRHKLYQSRIRGAMGITILHWEHDPVLRVRRGSPMLRAVVPLRYCVQDCRFRVITSIELFLLAETETNRFDSLVWLPLAGEFLVGCGARYSSKTDRYRNRIQPTKKLKTTRATTREQRSFCAAAVHLAFPSGKKTEVLTIEFCRHRVLAFYKPEIVGSTEMKSGRKRHPGCALEEVSSDWVVTKQIRPTIKPFDSDSKCTASTMDSSTSYDYSSSSSSSSSSYSDTSTTSLKHHARRRARTLDNHSNTTRRHQLASDRTTRQQKYSQPPKQPSTMRNIHTAGYCSRTSSIEIEPIPTLLIPKELRDHCGKGSYWTVPTSKRRRKRDANLPPESKSLLCDQSESAKDTKPIQTTKRGRNGCAGVRKGNSPEASSNSADNDPKTGRKLVGTERRVRTKDAQNANSDRSIFHRSRSNDCKNKKYTNNNNDGKVRLIRFAGARSKWFWIDDPSSNTSASSGKRTIVNKKEESTAATAATTTTTTLNESNINISTDTTANTRKIPNSSMNHCLRALRDHCGQGTYWTEPTQRRRRVSRNQSSWSDKKKTVVTDGECNKRAASSKTSKARNCEDDASGNNNHSSYTATTISSSISFSSDQKNAKPNGKRNPKRARNRQKDDPTPSTNASVERNSPHTCVTKNVDHSTKRTRRTNSGKLFNNNSTSIDGFRDKTKTSSATLPTVKIVPQTPAIADVSDNRKTIFRAIEGPDRPIHQYALDLISLVCNNSLVIDGSMNFSRQTDKSNRPFCQHLQVHRVLDKPLFGYTADTESEKERLMRLQFRQRFASATSTGMSPIEFAKKLLGLWGGTLEEVPAAEETESSSVDNSVDQAHIQHP